MAESINKYDGFYVGRYETSRNGETPQSKRSTYASGSGELVVTACNTSTESDWYGLYALNKRYSTTSVQGSMMWGIQYDKMMSWMGNSKTNITIGENRNMENTCGTAPNDVINNVYDIYGNSLEWTMTAWYEEMNSRVARSGSSEKNSGNRKPSAYMGASFGWRNDGKCGSRLALFVL